MHLSVGDKVRYLNDVGEGIVTEIIDDKMVTVASDDDFERPVLANELVKIGDNENYVSPEQVLTDNKQDKDVTEEIDDTIPDEENNEKVTVKDDETKEEVEEESNEDEEGSGILMGFVPADSNDVTASDLNAYLINDSSYYLLYNIVIREEGYTATISSGELEPDTKLFLSVYERKSLNYLSGFTIQIILFKKGIYEPVHPVEKNIKIKPVRFYLKDNFRENDYFDDPAYIIPVCQGQQEEEDTGLTKDQIRELIRDKQQISDVREKEEKKKSSPDTPVIEEVDLHIQQLIDNYKGLSNGEMLQIQIGHFRSALEDALARHLNKIVFIHGIGNGTLKLQLRKILETEYSNLKYQDASFKEYGYGATLVICNR